MPAEVHPHQQVAGRRFVVVWQDPLAREPVQVGTLVVNDSAGARTYEFSYCTDAATHPRFQAFPAFPDLDGFYRQEELFAFFQNRVMSPRRPDYPEYLSALGLDPHHGDPVELLARTGGGRETDTIQIVPAPVVEGDREVLHFLVSGVRHIDPEGLRLARLAPGTPLHIRPEPDNEFDARALLLHASADEPVGYVPSYLLDYVHKRAESNTEVRITVGQVNGQEVPSHLRLLCRMEADAPGHKLPYSSQIPAA